MGVRQLLGEVFTDYLEVAELSINKFRSDVIEKNSIDVDALEKKDKMDIKSN